MFGIVFSIYVALNYTSIIALTLSELTRTTTAHSYLDDGTE